MDEPAVVVGVITKAHGLKGEVIVQNRSDNPERWTTGSTVFLGPARLTVGTAKPHGRSLLVSFLEVADRTGAERIRGEVTVPAAWLPDLPEGEYWPHELEGCEVVTQAGRSLGVIAEVVPNPANDLWVAVDADGLETLVPALKDVLVEVDTKARRIVVREIPGITAPGGD